MNICMNGTTGHLQGELTQSGVTNSCIESLTVSLQQLAARGETHMRIDCNRVGKADLSGLRLLYVWIQCAKLRGVELELVNLSDCLQQAMQTFGLGDCFSNKMA